MLEGVWQKWGICFLRYIIIELLLLQLEVFLSECLSREDVGVVIWFLLALLLLAVVGGLAAVMDPQHEPRANFQPLAVVLLTEAHVQQKLRTVSVFESLIWDCDDWYWPARGG